MMFQYQNYNDEFCNECLKLLLIAKVILGFSETRALNLHETIYHERLALENIYR